MAATSEIIKKIAITFLQDKKINYSKVGDSTFHLKGAKHSKHDVNYWVVPYTYMVFQEEDAFIYINDGAQQVMYISTKHGYIYPDKQQEAGHEIEDDNESWDDL